jgi:putative flippase GtrA
MDDEITTTQKSRGFSKQFAGYFVVALIGYGVDFGSLVLLHEVFGVHYLIAAGAGFVAGLIVNYLLSSKFVFTNSKLQSRSAEFGMFAVIGLAGLGLLTVLMWLFTDVLHGNYLVSKIIATVFVYLWNFFGRKALYND